jgi:hypothetical protein
MENYMPESRPALLHADYFDNPQTGLTPDALLDLLEAPQVAINRSAVAVAEVAVTAAVVSYNDSPAQLRRMFTDLQQQDFIGDVQTLFVNAGNDDASLHEARNYVSEEDIVTVKPGPYFRADVLNAAFERARHDFVYTTVGHAALSNNQVFNTGVSTLLKENHHGTYGIAIPDINASRIERVGAKLLGAHKQLAMGAVAVSKGMGLMAADSAFWRRETVGVLEGFTRAYGAGGADGQLGQTMAVIGTVIRHPLLAFHHTHGFGPRDAARQLLTWRQSARPHNYRPQDFNWHKHGGL